MKKFLRMGVALLAFSAGAAEAQIDLNIGINDQPVVVRPAAYPSYVSGRERHRDYDWNYWHQQQLARDEQARREAEERRMALARDHHDEHHDNGRHLGQYKHDNR